MIGENSKTADDTFRVLTRRPFDEVVPLFNKYKTQRRGKTKEATFLRKHGWLYHEYIKESMRRMFNG